jgi:nickel-dependent lactate racemase
MPWISEQSDHITAARLASLMDAALDEARRRITASPQRVLLLPPDITRKESGSGKLTEVLYQRLSAAGAEVHVIPTLGQHVPHTPEENRQMFGSVPQERIHAHDWKGGCVQLGEIEADFVHRVSGGAADWPIPIGLNRRLMEDPWDLVINIGHVVPHEVLGFANHNKNYFIGVGAKATICASHMMAASCGIENNLGTLTTPTRRVFNEAESRYLGALPDFYIQLVLKWNHAGQLVTTGVHVGDEVETYLAAARQSERENITVLDEPLRKVVAVMGGEFHSTWVANKAVYRTRMAIADGGELVIIAHGACRFGEQPEVDALIRKYGYSPRAEILAKYADPHHEFDDLRDIGHGAAHLIHGSSEGRFRITYAPSGLAEADVRQVGYDYVDYTAAARRYAPDQSAAGAHRREGHYKTQDGEEFYLIPSPATGLWATREKLENRTRSAG